MHHTLAWCHTLPTPEPAHPSPGQHVAVPAGDRVVTANLNDSLRHVLKWRSHNRGLPVQKIRRQRALALGKHLLRYPRLMRVEVTERLGARFCQGVQAVQFGKGQVTLL